MLFLYIMLIFFCYKVRVDKCSCNLKSPFERQLVGIVYVDKIKVDKCCCKSPVERQLVGIVHADKG